jgi:hypothetical protein
MPILKPETLAALPSDLLAELKQAAIQGGMDAIERIIEIIRSNDAALADGLKVLADEFEYGRIVGAIEKSRGEENE